jgi:hypothetical protein
MIVITSDRFGAAWQNRGFLSCRCCPPATRLHAAIASRKSAGVRGAPAKKGGAGRSAAKPAPRRIDVHNHIAPPSYIEALGAERLQRCGAGADQPGECSETLSQVRVKHWSQGSGT